MRQPLGGNAFCPYRAILKPPLEVVVNDCGGGVSQYYGYNSEQASRRASSDESFHFLENGTAIIEEAVVDGKSTYILRKYTSPDLSDLPSWKRLYIDYVKENPPPVPESTTYQLVYINDDNAPELLIDYGITAYSGVVCTVSNGKLEVVIAPGVSYIERKNIFMSSRGRMDSYTDTVYSIQNGKFIILHGGVYGAINNANGPKDAQGNFIYKYNWDGKDVSEAEYKRLLSSVFDESKAAKGTASYTQDEIINAIVSF